MRHLSRLLLPSLAPLFLLSACQDSGSSTSSTPPADVQQRYVGLSDDEQLKWNALSSNSPQDPTVEVVGNEVIFRLPGYYTGVKTVNGQDYARVVVPGHSPLLRAQYPELPKVHANLIVSELTVQARLVDSKSQLVDTLPPLPARGDITRNTNPADVPYIAGPFYASSGEYPESPLQQDESFILRELNGASLQFHPVVYLPAQGKLRIYSEIRVRLDSVGGASSQRGGSSAFEPIYAGTFANYASALGVDAIAEPGRMLIITADKYYDAVVPLRDWKLQRGLQTSIKKLSEVGTTAAAIKTYIAQEFASPTSLTYVLLVGDLPDLPTLQGKYERANCDACYGMIAGNDYYPDLFVSRLSAQNVEQAENQVAKFINYEKNPEVGATWYNRAIGVASAEGSPTDYARAEELRKTLESVGYTAAKIYDPGAKTQTLTNELNAGASLLNYLGHGSGTSWSTASWDTGDVFHLENGSKLPVVIDVSCLNGEAELDTCLAESWLRAGTKAKPAGALASYSASTNAAWVPPTVMQKWAVEHLASNTAGSSIGSLCFGGAAQVLGTGTSGEGQQLVEQYNIFGDASIIVRTKAPKALQVEHPPQAEASSTFQVAVKDEAGKAVAGARVVLSNTSNVLSVGHSNSDGIATLDVPASCDGARLTVTAADAVPYLNPLK